jgi:hypothetical protein
MPENQRKYTYKLPLRGLLTASSVDQNTLVSFQEGFAAICNQPDL